MEQGALRAGPAEGRASVSAWCSALRDAPSIQADGPLVLEAQLCFDFRSGYL